MIADLLAVPTLSQPDLINYLFPLTHQDLHLRLGLFLTASETHWSKTELADVRVEVLGELLDLLLSDLCSPQEVQVLLLYRHDLLVVSSCDHPVTDFDALVG